MSSALGKLHLVPATERPDLLAEPVAAVIDTVPDAYVTQIDPDLADTAALCETYEVAMDVAANCVVVAGTRGGVTRYAARVVLATTRADVNGLVRKRLDARKASFAPMDVAVAMSGMEYGGITPVGLPPEWLLLVDEAVVATAQVVVGSGVRRSKLVVPGAALAALQHSEVVPGLGRA